MPQPPLHIAIVGAGPGGLLLARMLHLAGLQATVFEREPGPLYRPQGGTLDLHEHGGLRALGFAGLLQAFAAVARPEDQGNKLYNRHGELLFDETDTGEGGRPEVDRSALRALLLASVPPGWLRWGQAVDGAEVLADGRWRLVLDGGRSASEPFDLVVGADGAGSRLRPLLSAYPLQYSGLTMLEFGIDDVDARHPELARLVGRGKMMAQGEGRSLIVQRNGHAHLRGYAIFRVPVDWAARRFDLAMPERVQAQLLEEFAGFAPSLRALLHASNGIYVPRPIHALPVGHRWAHRRGLTLIGDAAHLMSPFGGEGVNAALLDAANLGLALTQTESVSDDRSDWDAAVASAEDNMFERVIEAAAGSADAAAEQLSHVGETLALEHLMQHQAHRLQTAAPHA
jgi:2-polyprenyl-6-methoxyphenol hydroxylase-like FAD-dependent oxidoreductase